MSKRVNLDTQAILDNLEAVRTGAMVHDAGADAVLLRLRLIRRNGSGWYDLTRAGRMTLCKTNGGAHA